MNSDSADVGGRIEADWADFGERLTAYLTGMVDGAVLTMDVIVGDDPDDGCAPWVQVLRVDGRLPRIEVPANDYLATRHRLDATAQRRLRRHGFTADTALDLFGQADNHVLRADSDTLESLASLAESVVWVLRRVLGVIHPTMLEITGARDGSRWASLAHMPPPETTAYPPPAQVPPTGPDALSDLIGQAFAHWMEAPARRDDDGDFPIMLAGCPFWVQSSAFAPVVRIYGFVVTDVADRAGARRMVRRLTVRSDLGTYHLAGDRVVLEARLPAVPFVHEHLRFSMNLLESQLEGDLERLARKTGGVVARVATE